MSSDKFTNVKTCHYKILGIEKNATGIEIKKAYKKCAIKCHPDRHQDDKELNEKNFKEVNEAYSILSDPQTKLNYDNFGFHGTCRQENNDPNSNFQHMNPNDIFRHIFGNMNMNSENPFTQNVNNGTGHPFVNNPFMNNPFMNNPFVQHVNNGVGHPFVQHVNNGVGHPFVQHVNNGVGHPFIQVPNSGNPFGTFTFISRNM